MSVESKLEQRLFDHNILQATPSLRVQAVKGGKKVLDLSLGKEYPYYDLASLTKIIFTSSAFMWALNKNKLKLGQKITSFKPDWPYGNHSIKGLLQHNVGLPWWNAYYKKLRALPKNATTRREALWRELLKEKPDLKRKKATYSDLDFLVLGYVLEEVFEKGLSEIWQDLSGRWKLDSVHFCKQNRPKYPKKLYAPTEKCPWRKKLLQGEVHDDNTWSMLGVSSHAGLFGNIDDVVKWGQLYRRAYLGLNEKLLASEQIARGFGQRSLPAHVGDWGLGFMKPTAGGASCGSRFSLSSIGHTGFTGTSFWWDPRKDLMVVILSNRVSPTRKNQAFVRLRPLIHDWICELV